MIANLKIELKKIRNKVTKQEDQKHFVYPCTKPPNACYKQLVNLNIYLIEDYITAGHHW